MTTLTEVSTYVAGIYQLETTDPVLGGPGGIANTQAQQLANRTNYLKAHVDALEAASAGFVTAAALQTELQKLDHKQSVRAASVANLTLSGTQTIDGVNVIVGDRVLVKNQTTASDNGIYVVSGSAWSRAVDADVSADVTPGMIAEVEEGTINAAQRWQVTTPAPIVLGTTNLTFANISAGFAPIASPAFTGTPTAPTVASGDATTKVATTAFANNLAKGLAGINVAGNTDVVVTAAQAGAAILKLTGALTGNINLIFPTASGQWIVSNEATGNFSITAKMATGTGVILPQALATVIYSDSTNVIFAASAGQYAFVPQTITPSAGTTSMPITGGYTPGLLLIEKNGAWLHLSDYTATDGANVVVAATTAGDKFTVYAFKSFTVANAVLKAGDTMGGFLSLAADATSAMHAVTKQQWDAANALLLAKSGGTMTGALAMAAGSTTPTPTVGDNSTNVASTAYVKTEIANQLNASGSAPLYGVRAWVNFNGTGTPAIRGSGNVSSITDNGVGDFTVNFTVALPDANYAMMGTCSKDGTYRNAVYLHDSTTQVAGSCRVATWTTAGGANDAVYNELIFVR